MIKIINLFRSDKQRSLAERSNYISTSHEYSASSDYMAYGKDYWDDTISPFGYKGYVNDGRNSSIADKLISTLNIKPSSRILEVGCARGFLLLEFYNRGHTICGVDVSQYAIETSSPEIRQYLHCSNILEWNTDTKFDLILCKDMLPHVHTTDLPAVLSKLSSYGNEHCVIALDIKVAESEQVAIKSRLFDPTQMSLLSSDCWLGLIKANIDKDVVLWFEELF